MPVSVKPTKRQYTCVSNALKNLSKTRKKRKRFYWI
jgi:hypothetical protein